MNLIFSFSTHIGDYKGGRYTKDDKTDHVLELYKVAMERANDFGHEVKFYGCDYCIDFLKGYYRESVSVENIDFDITDDLKMYIHSKEESGIVTIDGDLILNKKLKINENADVVFEQIEEVLPNKNPSWSQAPEIFKSLEKYDVYNKFKHFIKGNDTMYNVGILYFKNNEIKKIFLDSFYNIKKWYLTNVEPNEKLIPKGVIVSVILCQYYFKCISDKNKLNVEFAENTNDYKHYFGHAKFHDKIFNIVKNKKTTI